MHKSKQHIHSTQQNQREREHKTESKIEIILLSTNIMGMPSVIHVELANNLALMYCVLFYVQEKQAIPEHSLIA